MTLLKKFQGEQDKELEREVGWIADTYFKDTNSTAIHVALMKLKEKINSREEALLKRIGEEVERMRKSGSGENCSCHISSPCDACTEVDFEKVDAHNNLVDDIKSILQ